jgi:transcriptional regulator with XRE-family HTH domain
MKTETLSKILVERRQALALTQTALADLVGVSQQALGKWEAGTSTPRPSYVPRLAEVLGVAAEIIVAAKMAQAQKTLLKNEGIAPQSDAAAPVNISGYGLLTMLASALEQRKLQAHQIAALGSLVNSFVCSVPG